MARRRSVGFDAGLAAVLVAVALVDAFRAPRGQVGVALVEGVQASSVGLRRVAPVAAAGMFLVGAAVEVGLGSAKAGDAGVIAVLVLLGSVASLAEPRQRRIGLAVVALGIVTLRVAHSDGEPVGDFSHLLLVGLTSAGAFTIGWALRRRAERESEFTHSADLREQAWASRQREILEDERRRIARELHDVVGHALAGIAVSAGAARRHPDSPPEVDEALELILTASRQASADMRRLVGLLRTESDAADREPQPTLDSLAGLIDGARSAGIDVSYRVTGTPVAVARSLQLVVYRIVQESLTNAMRHAQGAAVSVELGWDRCQVGVAVTDNGHAPASREPTSGHGLTGLRERVLLYGGEFNAGPAPGGGFAVQATLPLS